LIGRGAETYNPAVIRASVLGTDRDRFTWEDLYMRRILVPVALVAVAALGCTASADELKSGLQVGESAGAFNVKDVTGPAKGTSLCYR